jgi:hydroxymethylpyrimidine pyrophosphatase-like HAD family hydrolase
MGAIAENGGIVYWGAESSGERLSSIEDFSYHRQKLGQMFQTLQLEFPHIQESRDNQFRLTDWTFDISGISPEELTQMHDRCQAHGFGFTYSTVQCHIKPLEQDKAIGLNKVLHQTFSDLAANQVITVGDSPNDESLFDPYFFPLSVGVANIKTYVDYLTHLPAYMTQASEAEGFCELAKWVVKAVKTAK